MLASTSSVIPNPDTIPGFALWCVSYRYETRPLSESLHSDEAISSLWIERGGFRRSYLLFRFH